VSISEGMCLKLLKHTQGLAPSNLFLQKQNKQSGVSSSQPTKCQNFWCCLIDGQKGVVGLVMLAV